MLDYGQTKTVDTAFGSPVRSRELSAERLTDKRFFQPMNPCALRGAFLQCTRGENRVWGSGEG